MSRQRVVQGATLLKFDPSSPPCHHNSMLRASNIPSSLEALHLADNNNNNNNNNNINNHSNSNNHNCHLQSLMHSRPSEEPHTNNFNYVDDTSYIVPSSIQHYHHQHQMHHFPQQQSEGHTPSTDRSPPSPSRPSHSAHQPHPQFLHQQIPPVYCTTTPSVYRRSHSGSSPVRRCRTAAARERAYTGGIEGSCTPQSRETPQNAFSQNKPFEDHSIQGCCDSVKVVEVEMSLNGHRLQVGESEPSSFSKPHHTTLRSPSRDVEHQSNQYGRLGCSAQNSVCRISHSTREGRDMRSMSGEPALLMHERSGNMLCRAPFGRFHSASRVQRQIQDGEDFQVEERRRFSGTAAGTRTARLRDAERQRFVSSQQEKQQQQQRAGGYEFEIEGQRREASGSRTQLQCFKTKLCHFHLLKKCTRGRECSFAHNGDEVRLPPDLSKTKMCVRWKKGLCHADSRMCTYAHGNADLRPLVPLPDLSSFSSQFTPSSQLSKRHSATQLQQALQSTGPIPSPLQAGMQTPTSEPSTAAQSSNQESSGSVSSSSNLTEAPAGSVLCGSLPLRPPQHGPIKLPLLATSPEALPSSVDSGVRCSSSERHEGRSPMTTGRRGIGRFIGFSDCPSQTPLFLSESAGDHGPASQQGKWAARLAGRDFPEVSGADDTTQSALPKQQAPSPSSTAPVSCKDALASVEPNNLSYIRSQVVAKSSSGTTDSQVLAAESTSSNPTSQPGPHRGEQRSHRAVCSASGIQGVGSPSPVGFSGSARLPCSYTEEDSGSRSGTESTCEGADSLSASRIESPNGPSCLPPPTQPRPSVGGEANQNSEPRNLMTAPAASEDGYMYSKTKWFSGITPQKFSAYSCQNTSAASEKVIESSHNAVLDRTAASLLPHPTFEQQQSLTESAEVNLMLPTGGQSGRHRGAVSDGSVAQQIPSNLSTYKTITTSLSNDQTPLSHRHLRAHPQDVHNQQQQQYMSHYVVQPSTTGGSSVPGMITPPFSVSRATSPTPLPQQQQVAYIYPDGGVYIPLYITPPSDSTLTPTNVTPSSASRASPALGVMQMMAGNMSALALEQAANVVYED